MSDKFDEYYDNREANEDSKSDAYVALVIIVVGVIAAYFGYLRNNNLIHSEIFLHPELPCNQSQLK
jgi:uncharacterized membrane protein YidH (DUF202 family)